jgi:hypothetical protein
MSYWIITDSGKVISRTSVEHVVHSDHLDEAKRKEIDAFNEKLKEILDDGDFILNEDQEFQGMYLDDVEVDDRNANLGIQHGDDMTPTAEEYGDMIVDERPDDDDEDVIDNYLNAELLLDVSTNNERRGRVIKRAKGNSGEPIGRAHANPLFDTRQYEIEFTDGTRERYQANVIAENMYAQVDAEGHQYQILDEITDHRKDHTAIPISEGTITSHNGTVKPKVTTRGWQLLVQFKDGTLDWVKLKDLKESNLIELAEYAVANQLVEELAFKWWVPHVLR